MTIEEELSGQENTSGALNQDDLDVQGAEREGMSEPEVLIEDVDEELEEILRDDKIQGGTPG